MISPDRILLLATVLLAAGLWLLLPRGRAPGRAAGAVLTATALGLLASQWPGVGEWLSGSLFFLAAAATVFAAIATVTFRSPVYSAIWFGMTLTGTAGLFLLAGAEFLAAATLVIYAGAILVTFLFVLMLCQPEGHTSYDRRSWEAPLSAAAGAAMIGILSMALAGVLAGPRSDRAATERPAAAAEGAPSIPGPRAAVPSAGGPTAGSVARLGAELFSRHLIAVEVAGLLLFAALVGADVIVALGPARRNQH
jgi:NADH-quinone oxidoreductase subunit J